jgi:hypothetical protein
LSLRQSLRRGAKCYCNCKKKGDRGCLHCDDSFNYFSALVSIKARF